MGKKSSSYKYLTEVSHVVQVRAEGPKAPKAARPERACGAMLSLITPGQLGIKVYCKQNARLKNSLNPAFYFFCC